MSDSLNDQAVFQDDCAAAKEPAGDAPVEQHPEAAGVGRAQRSEPERSDGERSGARPTPAPSPSSAPGDSVPTGARTNVPYDPEPVPEIDLPQRLRLTGRSKGRRLVKKDLAPAPGLTAQQRLLLLDTWQRSGLPAGDFAALVGVSKHTLYAWKKKFDTQGPAGLMDQPKGGPRGSRLPDLTKRTILMLKQANPEWGCQRISDMLVRGPALPASASAVAQVLHEAGYQMEEVPTRPHPDKIRFFERAKPNQLWQTDLFTFVLKRQNRRVFLVAFMDDHSRFIVSYGLHASQSSALVLEVLRSGIASVRIARGNSHRQRFAVRDLARQERVHQGTGKTRHQASGGETAPAPDTRQGRTFLGHLVVRVHRERGVHRPWRCAKTDRPVHRPL